MGEMTFEERVRFTQYHAIRLMEHPEEPLDLSKKIIDFFELNLVEFQDMIIPQRCLDYFELFFSFYEKNGLNLKKYGSAIKQLDNQFKDLPEINRPKNEIELESKIKKISARFLALSLIEVWKFEEKTKTGDEFKRYIICAAIVFSMVIEEIYHSYYFDVLGEIPQRYRGRHNHSIPRLRTYLCPRCEGVFFSKSNNAKYCARCGHRGNREDRPARCLYCQKVLPIGTTKPKKYCDDVCRYADRKKKIISPVDSGERASF